MWSEDDLVGCERAGHPSLKSSEFVIAIGILNVQVARTMTPIKHITALLIFCSALAACGVGTQDTNTPPVTYTLGGTVTGLTSMGLVLQDKGSNNLPLSAGATSFTFATSIASGAAYDVTVLTQPS